MSEIIREHSMEWRESEGYRTGDEIRFVQRLAATNRMAFFQYAETVHLRTRWGRIDSRAVMRRVDQLLQARQPSLSLVA